MHLAVRPEYHVISLHSLSSISMILNLDITTRPTADLDLLCCNRVLPSRTQNPRYRWRPGWRISIQLRGVWKECADGHDRDESGGAVQLMKTTMSIFPLFYGTQNLDDCSSVSHLVPFTSFATNFLNYLHPMDGIFKATTSVSHTVTCTRVKLRWLNLTNTIE